MYKRKYLIELEGIIIGEAGDTRQGVTQPEGTLLGVTQTEDTLVGGTKTEDPGEHQIEDNIQVKEEVTRQGLGEVIVHEYLMQLPQTQGKKVMKKITL